MTVDPYVVNKLWPITSVISFDLCLTTWNPELDVILAVIFPKNELMAVIIYVDLKGTRPHSITAQNYVNDRPSDTYTHGSHLIPQSLV